MKKILILLASATLIITTSAFADFHEKIKRKANHPTPSHESSQMQLKEDASIKRENDTNDKPAAQNLAKKNKFY
ncbi:MAG: hypothetical protein WC748_08380 [Legionellales bacterium]|jgi:hypothetical protein